MAAKAAFATRAVAHCFPITLCAAPPVAPPDAETLEQLLTVDVLSDSAEAANEGHWDAARRCIMAALAASPRETGGR